MPEPTEPLNSNGPPDSYLVPELHRDTSAGHNVEATVFVDCVWGIGPAAPNTASASERADLLHGTTSRVYRI